MNMLMLDEQATMFFQFKGVTSIQVYGFLGMPPVYIKRMYQPRVMRRRKPTTKRN